METSLGIEFEQEAKLVESAARRKEREVLKLRSNQKTFLERFKLVKEYFLRLDTFKKREFLLKLLHHVRNTDSVMHIMHFLPIGYGKACNYSLAEPRTRFLYEKPVIDHDRMLDSKMLEETLQNDIEWYQNLPDTYQILLFIGLLRRGGGYIRRDIIKPVIAQYFRTTRKARMQALQASQEVEVKGNKKVQIKGSVMESKKVEETDDEEQYDPTHPATIEVEKQRKKFNDIIAKFKKEVENEERKMESRFGDAQPAAKGKPEKGGKSKASDKSSKKGGKGKKKGEEELDLVLDVKLASHSADKKAKINS